MTYLILTGLITATLFARKHSKVLSILWFSFAVILAHYNMHVADRVNYYTMYDRIVQNSNNERVEVGFQYLIKLSNFLGFSAEKFYFIIFAVSLCLYFISFKRYVRHPNIIFMLYIMFPFAVDAVQIRTMLADAIVIFALRYLEGYELKNKICFIALILAAALIHNSALFYILLLSFYIVRDKKKILLCSGISVLLVCHFIINNSLVDMLKRLAINGAAANYLTSFTITRRSQLYCLWVMLIILLYFFMYKSVSSKGLGLSTRNFPVKRNSFETNSAEWLWEIAFFANTIFAFTTVFVFFSVSFMRLARVFVLIDYIIFQIFMESKRNHARIKLSSGIYRIFLFVIVGMTIVINCGTIMESTYFAIFNHNQIISGF